MLHDLERNALRCTEAVLAGIAVYYAVSIVSAVVSPEAEAGISLMEPQGVKMPALQREPAHEFTRYAAIVERDVFNPPKPRYEPLAPIARSLPPLRAKLLGVAPSPGGRSFAIVEDPGVRAQALLAVGDELQGRTLVRITRNAAVFSSDTEREEILDLPVPPRSVRSGVRLDDPEPDDGTPRHSDAVLPPMPVADLDAAADPGGFADAQLTPEFSDGELLGIRISAIVPNSAYHALGFRNGDLLRSIDGANFAGPLPALQAVRALSGRTDGVVGVTRSRASLTLDIATELAAATKRGAADDAEGLTQAWNWKAEVSRRSTMRRRARSSERTSLADRAVWNRNEDRIPTSSPSDWSGLDLITIPMWRSVELSTTADLAGPRRSDRDYAPLPVTDMRLVHAGAIHLDHSARDPNLEKDKQ